MAKDQTETLKSQRRKAQSALDKLKDPAWNPDLSSKERASRQRIYKRVIARVDKALAGQDEAPAPAKKKTKFQPHKGVRGMAELVKEVVRLPGRFREGLGKAEGAAEEAARKAERQKGVKRR